MKLTTNIVRNFNVWTDKSLDWQEYFSPLIPDIFSLFLIENSRYVSHTIKILSNCLEMEFITTFLKSQIVSQFWMSVLTEAIKSI